MWQCWCLLIGTLRIHGMSRAPPYQIVPSIFSLLPAAKKKVDVFLFLSLLSMLFLNLLPLAICSIRLYSVLHMYLYCTGSMLDCAPPALWPLPVTQYCAGKMGFWSYDHHDSQSQRSHDREAHVTPLTLWTLKIITEGSSKGLASS